MHPESNGASLERTLYRRDAKSLVLRGYVLSLAECEKLVIDGFDLETVVEEVLSSRAIWVCEYDALGRLTRQSERVLSNSVNVTYGSDEPPTKSQ